MAHAIAMCQEEQAKPATSKKLDLWKVCKTVEKEYFGTNQIRVSLNHNTLQNLVNGGRTMIKMNAKKNWLMKEEAEEVIKVTIEMAAWGHGLDHQRLKELVDEIHHAWFQSKFPKEGAGQHWTHQFVEKYSDWLHVYTVQSLSNVCKQAVNLKTNELWQDLIKDTQFHGNDGKPIAPHQEKYKSAFGRFSCFSKLQKL
jgi:hypothetical protein